MSVQVKGSGTIGGLDEGLNVVGVVTSTSFVGTGVSVVGVVTATSFVGSGANLTSLPAANITGTLPAISGANLTSLPAQATIANNADNRVITGGSGVNLNGEAGLTYNGQALNVNSVTSENNAFRVYNTSTSATTFQINGEGNSFIGHTYPRSDANLDLGFHSGYRWRDVVLSGGIRFGSANSSDYLDDYEEGVYQPTMTGSGGGSHTITTYTHIAYTRIGRLVHIQGYININGGSLTGNLKLSLPFTVSNDASGHSRYPAIGLSWRGHGWSGNTGEITFAPQPNTTYGEFVSVTPAGSHTWVNNTHVSNSYNIRIGGCYITNT